MKFSIITPTYNSEKTVKDTLQSVSDQEFKDFEHVIVDGLSKDKTLEICHGAGENIQIFSESDRGIYDAMNKGIEKSKGEILGILNSDDFYFDSSVLKKVSEIFEKSDLDIVFGDIVYINPENISRTVRVWRTSNVKKWKLWLGWIMPHPAVFVRREVYEKLGSFDLNFRTAADYDFLLRCCLDKEIKMAHLENFLVKMRTGGNSDGGFVRRMKGIHEVCLVFKKNTGVYSFWFFVTRILIKIPQVFVKSV